MVPKLVFLDTEVFVQQNFQYERGLLAAFRQHVKAGRAQHIITEVTADEVRGRIAASVDEARGALRVYQNKARILQNSQSGSIRRLFKMPSRKKAMEDLGNQFATYLDDLGSTVLPTDSVAPSAVFAQYFRREPPFGASRKKSEFPDAFAIEALRLYSAERNCDIAVVTEDPDWIAAVAESNRLVHFQRLDQLLESLQAEMPLLPVANNAIDALKPEIQEHASAELQNVSFVVADRTATVVSVQAHHVMLDHVYVADVTETGVVFSADAWIGFEVFVEYKDTPAVGEPLPWDVGGHKRYGYFRNPDAPETLNSGESFALLGTASWETRDKETLKLDHLGILRPRTVAVYFGDYYSGS